MLLKEIARSVEEAIAEVIKRGYWQHYEGPNASRLEAQIAHRTRQSHVQLTSSGTAAMEIILRAAGLGPGHEVMISSYDYPGNFWAIERAGARPVLVDTTPCSWRIDRESLDRAFQPSCKALIASHLHGELQEVDALRIWCDDRNVILIEDVCQSLGAQWKDLPVGAYGHAAILSFGGGKLLSCGRGGAWATSNETLAIKARVAAGAGSGPYTLSELQAATVLAQFPWLDEVNLRCRDFFGALDRQLQLENLRWTFVPKSSLNSTAFYQCGWQLDENANKSRDKILTALHRLPHPDAVLELPFGQGFPGFHRRSAKRCRIADSLQHATTAAHCTLVLHHRVVLQQQWTPEQLAKWIASRIASVDEHDFIGTDSGSSS